MIHGELLAASDAQLRGMVEAGDDAEADGPLLRRIQPSGGFVAITTTTPDVWTPPVGG